MDPIHIIELLQLAKAASPWGAGAIVALGFFRLIREPRQPAALAKAVKSLDSRQEQQTLVELFRIAHLPKSSEKGSSKRNREK